MVRQAHHVPVTQPKRALVLEGGAMRSAYLSGVLNAFHERNLTDFDVVIGSSAGACCGAHFVAGEPHKNSTIILEHLTGPHFVRLKKIFSQENIVDIDYLIDEVCRKKVLFSMERLKNSKTLLYMTATDYQTGEVVYFNQRDHDLFEALRASCALPYLYRKKVLIGGRRYMDGGLFESIPLKKALELGCTEIVVVSTRERGYRKKKTGLPLWLYNACSDNPRMGEFFHQRDGRYNATLEIIQNPPPGVAIHLVAPRQKLPVSRTTKDRAKVAQAMELGRQDGQAFAFSGLFGKIA